MISLTSVVVIDERNNVEVVFTDKGTNQLHPYDRLCDFRIASQGTISDSVEI